MDFLAEIWNYLKTRKRFWLIPLLVALLLLGALVSATAGTAIAPFIYTVF